MLFLIGVFLLCSSSIFIYATSSNVRGFGYVFYLPHSSISFMQLDLDVPGKIKYKENHLEIQMSLNSLMSSLVLNSSGLSLLFKRHF